MDACETCFGPCVVAAAYAAVIDSADLHMPIRCLGATGLNFEYNDRRKKIIPNKVQARTELN